MDIRTIISAALILVGAIFLWTAAIGVVRFPDFFSRLHAAGIGDTLGALLLTVGIMVKTGLTLLSLKVFLVFAWRIIGDQEAQTHQCYAMIRRTEIIGSLDRCSAG